MLHWQYLYTVLAMNLIMIMQTLIASCFSYLADNTPQLLCCTPQPTVSLVKGKVTEDPHNSLKP